MRVLARRGVPQKPRNVRVERPDGTSVPCELVYEGRSADGTHVWVAVTPLAAPEPGGVVNVRCDLLPARTSIVVGFVEEF